MEWKGSCSARGARAAKRTSALQRYAKQLKERGIILAVCSKNDLATAEAVFRRSSGDVLQRSDIAAFVANWNDKAENLKAIAEQLNIGVDSLVFVDDNPAERARVREALPMVAVPELPDGCGPLRALPRRVRDISRRSASRHEDRQRAAQYAANAERAALRGGSQSMDDFLRGLEMSVVFRAHPGCRPVRASHNSSTRPISSIRRRDDTAGGRLELRERAGDSLTLQFRLVDRFGDNGLVSVMILRPDPDERDVLEIDSWVMSCRVFGRQLEVEAMNIAVEAARESRRPHSACRLHPDQEERRDQQSVPRPRILASSTDPATADGATRWSLDIADYVARPTCISSGGTIAMTDQDILDHIHPHPP